MSNCNCNCECEAHTNPDSNCAYFSGRALTFAEVCEIGLALGIELSVTQAFLFARAIIAAERKKLMLPHDSEDLAE